eukprot:COSAG02_NODE_997_length_15333_cov_13.688526_2_plen_126_part_00
MQLHALFCPILQKRLNGCPKTYPPAGGVHGVLEAARRSVASRYAPAATCAHFGNGGRLHGGAGSSTTFSSSGGTSTSTSTSGGDSSQRHEEANEHLRVASASAIGATWTGFVAPIDTARDATRTP